MTSKAIIGKSRSLKKQLELKLDEINTILRENYQSENNIGLIDGLSGISLFQFYYAKHTNNDLYAEWGQDTLIRIISLINTGVNIPSYSIGFAGVGWTFDHLKNHGFIELNNDDLLNNFDDYLLNKMKSDLKVEDYDFLHGGLGYAFYFLSRYKSTNNKILKNKYTDNLEFFIKNLQCKIEYDKNGIKWLSKIKSRDISLQGYNLSLSHGMSSTIAFLCESYKHNIFREECKFLITQTINYFLSLEFTKDEGFSSLFPSWVLKKDNIKKASRLGWCYGDFSIGLSCLRASNILNDKLLEQKAYQILKHTTKRTTYKDTLVVDASLCHGAFGNAQIYNSIYNKSKDPLYKDSARYWINFGLQLSSYKDGYAGFKQWYGEPDGWQPKTSLLEGIAGIGLSIIDYLSEQPNYWDECLLIS